MGSAHGKGSFFLESIVASPSNTLVVAVVVVSLSFFLFPYEAQHTKRQLYLVSGSIGVLQSESGTVLESTAIDLWPALSPWPWPRVAHSFVVAGCIKLTRGLVVVESSLLDSLDLPHTVHFFLLTSYQHGDSC